VGLLGGELLLVWELKDKSSWKSPPGTTLFKCQSKFHCGYDTVSEMQWRLLTTAISTLLFLCLLVACHKWLSKPPWWHHPETRPATLRPFLSCCHREGLMMNIFLPSNPYPPFGLVPKPFGTTPWFTSWLSHVSHQVSHRHMAWQAQ